MCSTLEQSSVFHGTHEDASCLHRIYTYIQSFVNNVEFYNCLREIIRKQLYSCTLRWLYESFSTLIFLFYFSYIVYHYTSYIIDDYLLHQLFLKETNHRITAE